MEASNNKKKSANILSQGKRDVSLSNYEINAQIASIKQLKRVAKKTWDTLSFDEVIRLNSSLDFISDELKLIGEYENWKKKILNRLYREKLLGKSMVKNQ